MTTPQLIAFDFDGVICDGLIEYFQTAWRAHCQLFKPASNLGSNPDGDPDSVQPPEGLAERFYPLRPVVETGWEMPVLVEALMQGMGDATLDAKILDAKIIKEWPEMALPYLQAAGLTKAQSVQALDSVRDQWIQRDLAGWLNLHRFYPGMIERVREVLAGDIPIYIVSTKEGRFIQALLAQSGLDFPAARIFGKGVKRPKYETLRLLKEKHQIERVWFVEDRLPALKSVAQQSDLVACELFLADWGYNLAPDRDAARQDDRIHLLSLQKVVQEFDCWMS